MKRFYQREVLPLDRAWLGLLFVPLLVVIARYGQWALWLEAGTVGLVLAVLGGAFTYHQKKNEPSVIRLRHEFKAIGGLWLVAVLVPLVALKLGDDQFSFGSYWVAAALLGASVFGSEFTHRTMPLLLSQPMSRHRLRSEKGRILWVSLASSWFLWLVTNLVLLSFSNQSAGALFSSSGSHFGDLMLWVSPILNAVACAPYLTLIAKSIIGGAVFSLLPPITVLLTGVFLESHNFGLLKTSDHAFAGQFFAAVMPVLWIAFSAMGRRRFARLEIVEAQDHELASIRALTLPLDWILNCFWPRNGGPVSNLIRKELKLHQSGILLALIFSVCWLTVAGLRALGSDFSDDFLLPVLIIYIGAVAIVIGAVSTAEERGMGLLDWHLTLPASAIQQWTVKVAVALAAALLLAVGLPLGLLKLAGLTAQFAPASGPDALMTNLIRWTAPLGLTLAGIYASSLSRNTLRALVLSIGYGSAMILSFAFVSVFLVNGSFLPTGGLIGVFLDESKPDHTSLLNAICVFLLLFLAVIALIASIAFSNFRHADARGWSRHVCAFLVSVLVGLIPTILLGR